MNYVSLLLPDFLLILSGYLLCRFIALNEKIWGPVESLVYYLLFPALLFTSISKSHIELSSLVFIACGLFIAICAIVVSLFLLPRLPLIGRYIQVHSHAGGAQIAYRFNSFIALSLSERIAGPEGLFLMAMLIAVCVPIVNVFAVWPMAKQSNHQFLTELRKNPLIVTTLLALSAKFIGFQIPPLLEPTLTRMGASSIVLGLMAAGAGLKWQHLSKDKVLSVSLLSIRHIFSPLLCLILLRFVPLSTTESQILITFAALPTASRCYVLASRMGYNGPYVAGLITLSVLIGMLSLPIALSAI